MAENSLCEICRSDVVVNAKNGFGSVTGYIELFDGTFLCRRHLCTGQVEIAAVYVDGKCREVKIDGGK